MPRVSISVQRLVVALVVTACVPSTRSTTPATTPTAAVEQAPAADPSVCPPANYPDTPAGRRLAELIAVLNSTDPAAAERFVSTAISPEFTPPQPPPRIAESITGSGPTIALCRIEANTERRVTAILEDTDAMPGNEFGWIIVTVDPNDLVTSIGIAHVTRDNVTDEAEPLDDAGVSRVVDDIADGLAGYVFADAAEQMATRIRTARDAGEYAGITDGRTLAWRLGNDLRAVTGDDHLDVFYSSVAFAPIDPSWEPSADETEALKQRAALDHYGMPVAEIRDGNVGYLVVTSFLPAEFLADALAETMSKLAAADVLVIDLRETAGGIPDGVALMTSYLFGPEPVHLYDVHRRSEGRTESIATTSDLAGPRFGPTKPVYVLTSHSTISAGEAFAYNLQAYGRATIVGETTDGSAHGTDVIPVSNHWAVALPTERPIHPLTKTNWEAIGVTPDVEVPAAQALDTALELAVGRGSGANLLAPSQQNRIFAIAPLFLVSDSDGHGRTDRLTMSAEDSRHNRRLTAHEARLRP
jgi:hypothetical protein